ncbi:MAG: FAD/NAD(P)-binding protein [Planctomycetota bacterium]
MADSSAVMYNPYRPQLLRIAAMRDETPDVRTLTLRFVDEDEGARFPGWEPGQFGEFTVFGAGESVFALANPHRRERGAAPTLECTYRSIGKVTGALRGLDTGHAIGFRGPYGNSFPLHDWQGRDLVFLGGGIGMAALRAALLSVLDHRSDFGEVMILNGARTVADMVYKEEMPEWEKLDGVRVVRTVDPGGETEDWDAEVGLIPDVFERQGLSPDGRVIVACGPPIMLHFLFKSLEKTGYSPEQVVTTLENKMKCGFGQCGRCNVGSFYVCRDGPVVSWEQMQALPADF